MKSRGWVLALLLVVCLPMTLNARVVRVEIIRRTVVASGAMWGAGGAYERIEGRVYYAFDPSNPADRRIVDLDKAPRNAQGEVEASSDFVMYRPVDPARSNQVTLVDIVNRGGGGTDGAPFSLGGRAAAGTDSAAFYGDALLFRLGVTVVRLGWQFDVVRASGKLGFVAPIATDGGKTITGMVREEWLIGATAPRSLRLPVYPAVVSNDSGDVLLMRDPSLERVTVVPRSEWRFARYDSTTRGIVADSQSIVLESGFVPGRIYELVYRATNPAVAGTGLAAVRDFISYLKYDTTAIAPTRFGIAYGGSQVGRFQRDYLYEGFNADERGRTAYDGMFIFIAGAGRGSFNQRFAQPGRTSWGYNDFFYPIDVFPFTSTMERDPVTGARGALYGDSVMAHLPKIFSLDGGHEYWGRAASLATTLSDGSADVPLIAGERRYVIGSTGHGGGGGGVPSDTSRIAGSEAYRSGPVSEVPIERALITSLINWVKYDSTPPPSRYPTIAAGELVTPEHLAYPKIPGLVFARIPNQARRLDFGSRSASGIVDQLPPKLGAPYTILVPQADSAGNDRGGIRTVDVTAPVATYFPWQLRRGPGPTDRLTSGGGTTVPLPKTEAARKATGDSRPSLESLYGNREAYRAKVDAAAAALVAQRFMLREDIPVVEAQMLRRWDWVMGRP